MNTAFFFCSVVFSVARERLTELSTAGDAVCDTLDLPACTRLSFVVFVSALAEAQVHCGVQDVT